MKKATRKDPFLEQLDAEFDLEQILFMDDDYYHAVVHPIMYNYITALEVFQRNAAIALGNTLDATHIPALKKALATSTPMVREAAAWALDRIGSHESNSAQNASR